MSSSQDRVPFLDLLPAQADVRDAVDEVWRRTTSEATYVGGSAVTDFEESWAAYCGTSQAIGVGNGTDALELVLQGLGIGPGDEVIVPANTFVATAEAVVAVGATPFFVDVDPATLLITAESVRSGLTPRTAAVLVVHLYGQPADVPAIMEVASTAGIAVIEDAAQAHGATWNSRRTGSLAHAACFSFYPGKNLGAFGDGGAVTTNDEALARRLRSVADHGRAHGKRYEHERTGRNSRLDALQAGVLSAKLPLLDRWNELRRTAHAGYATDLSNSAGVTLPHQDLRAESAHHLEVVLVDERDAVRAHMDRAGIDTGIHYPVPCHLNAPFANFPRTDLPVSEAAARRCLSLPMFPYLDDGRVRRVSAALLEAVAHTSAGQSTSSRPLAHSR